MRGTIVKGVTGRKKYENYKITLPANLAKNLIAKNSGRREVEIKAYGDGILIKPLGEEEK